MTTDATTGSADAEVTTGSGQESGLGLGLGSDGVGQLPESSLPSLPESSRMERRMMSFGRKQTRANKAKEARAEAARAEASRTKAQTDKDPATTATTISSTTNTITTIISSNNTATATSNSNATAVKSFRHQLQEFCQKRGQPSPTYETSSIGTFTLSFDY